MTNTLQKVSDELYQEHFEEEGRRPFNWAKEYEFLDLDLFDIEAISRSEVTIKGVMFGSIESKTMLSSFIMARGKFEGRRDVQLIDKQPDDPHSFKDARVIIQAQPAWDNFSEEDELKHGRKAGYIMFICEDILRAGEQPHLQITIRVPPDIFESAWRQLTNGSPVAKVLLRTYVEAYRSEMDRSLSEHDQYQTFFIERKAAHHRALIASLEIHSPRIHPLPQDEENANGLREKPDQPLPKPVDVMQFKMLRILRAIAAILALGVVTLMLK